LSLPRPVSMGAAPPSIVRFALIEPSSSRMSIRSLVSGWVSPTTSDISGISGSSPCRSLWRRYRSNNRALLAIDLGNSKAVTPFHRKVQQTILMAITNADGAPVDRITELRFCPMGIGYACITPTLKTCYDDTLRVREGI